jgi:hypothetical protein
MEELTMNNAEDNKNYLHCNKCDCWYAKEPSRRLGDQCADIMWADGTFAVWSDGTINWANEDGTEPEPCDGTMIEMMTAEKSRSRLN